MNLQILLKHTFNIELLYLDKNMQNIKFPFNPIYNIHHTKLSNILTDTQINTLQFNEKIIKDISKYDICYFIPNDIISN